MHWRLVNCLLKIGVTEILSILPTFNIRTDKLLKQRAEPSYCTHLICRRWVALEKLKNLSFGQKIALIISSLIAIVASGGFLYFFISDCGDVLSSSGDYPFFSVGKNAKGYIAIGLAARGILTIGLFCEGIISFCVIGFGLLCFVGQVRIGNLSSWGLLLLFSWPAFNQHMDYCSSSARNQSDFSSDNSRKIAFLNLFW